MLETLRLRCEYADNPLGVDAPRPRLSWAFAPCIERGQVQLAFQVQAASTLEGLLVGQADVWDSGKITSPDPWADYGGPALISRQRCFWRGAPGTALTGPVLTARRPGLKWAAEPGGLAGTLDWLPRRVERAGCLFPQGFQAVEAGPACADVCLWIGLF